MIQTDVEEDLMIKELVAPNKSLILFNDPVNTFNHVIECLIKYCEHSSEQSHQCAMIIHNSGSYAVKHGSYDKLKPICEALQENLLTCNIE